MTPLPEIRLVRVEHGSFPAAHGLNPKIETAAPLLAVTLDIDWEPDDPRAAVADIERWLADCSPGFHRHECRGDSRYHVFRGRSAPPGRSDSPFDPALALAHLLEHAVIDLLCSLRDVERCSGVTGALAEPRGRFDLFVECPDLLAGRFCLALALSLLHTASAGGQAAPERRLVAAARRALARDGRLDAVSLAAELGWPEPQAAQALASLRHLGLLSEVSWAVNFSGIPEYRIVAG